VLVLALGATLVGFILLVVALVTGVLWLAIACIVVCVVGVGFLLADLVGLGRRSTPELDSATEDRSGSGHEQAADQQDPAAGGQGHRYDDDPPTEEIHLD
jgi:hypothetical protein